MNASCLRLSTFGLRLIALATCYLSLVTFSAATAVPSYALKVDGKTGALIWAGGTSPLTTTLFKSANGIGAGGGSALTPTGVKTANYTLAVGDFAVGDTSSGNLTFQLPTAPADQSIIGVKMVIQGGTNTITINTGGSDVLNKAGGGTSFTLTLVNQAVTFQYKTGGLWYVVNDDMPLAQLDLRYASVANVNTYFANPSANGSFSAATWRSNLALVIGTNVQAWNTNLDTWATKAVTATQTELNYVGGVTSALQTQLNGKQASGTKITAIEALANASGYLFNNGSGFFSYATPAGGGDFSSNTSTSVDSEFVLFSSTLGKTGKRAAGTGIARGASGVASFAELSGDATTSGSNAVTVVKINGISLAGLATGILKNTITTGAPSIAIAADFPTLNQNTTGTAANVSGTPALPSGTTASTQAVDDATTKLATDAFVLNQASAVNPVMDGSVAIGTSTRYARADHVHASDTSRLPVASPTSTGKFTTAASATGGAGFNLPQGAAPTSPANGDLWATSLGIYAQIAGGTVGPFGTGSGTAANPSATIGLTATNGAASTYMRSDASPALGVGIVPHWTAQHWFDLNPRITDNTAPTTGTSALALGTNYTLTLNANYSFTSVTGTSGISKIHLLACDGTHSFTWTTAAQRAGDPVGTTTTFTPTAGDHTFQIYYDTVAAGLYYVDDLTGTLGIAGGGTGATTALGALDGLQGTEATVASATTTDIGAATSDKVSITGTTTITSFGTKTAGVMRQGRFTGILTLTHNATSLILPNNGSNITTAAGDSFRAYSLGSGNWVVADYTRANGSALAGGGGSPGGSTTQIQFNNAGSFGGVAGLAADTTTGAVTQLQAALASTVVPGVTLTNTTAATSGQNQNSPALYLLGRGWGGSDQSSGVRIYNVAGNGTSTSSVTLTFDYFNGTSWQNIAQFGGSASNGIGTAFFPSAVSTNSGVTIGNSNGYNWNGKGGITCTGTDGIFTWTQSNGTTGAQVTSGAWLNNNPTSGSGYATGAGGTVTQATSRTTGVTLSKVSGAITTNTTSLAAAASATFTVTNTTVAATDVVVVSIKSGATNKETKVYVTATAAGSFDVTVHNQHASTAEVGAIIINFVVIKAVTS